MSHVDALSSTPIIAAIEECDVDFNIQAVQSRDPEIQNIRDK